MKELIESQKEFFNSNKTKDVEFRITQLRKLENLIKENEDLLNKAIYDDFKKSAYDNYTSELMLVYQEIEEACQNVKSWTSRKKVSNNLADFPAKSYIIPEPLGVSLIIGAWNYPYQLSFGPVVAAIAAGNTVILKPSELPANTSKAMAKIVNENFEPKFFKVVEGGIPETTELLEQKFDKIFFTGSVPVGKIVYQAAAKHLTPVTLELGGKSPAFVAENCDLEVSVKRLVWGKFLNSGQTCIAPDYILVHSSIKEKFLKQLKEEIKSANYSLESDNYVQIINEKNLNRLVGLIDESKVYIGGKHDSENRTIEPTVLTNIDFADEIMQEEIFGPILPVIEYTELDDVIAKVKANPKPLACYIFTGNNKIKDKILNEISFGGGCVNDTLSHITNSHLPFGGVGDSGIGAYHGEFGFRAFSHYKSVLDKATWYDSNFRYSPNTENKLEWIKWLSG